jgi:DNA invertase Pin-like site-specific DNA recombinase
MNVGYARVSTRDQTVALQIDALKAVGCGKVYTEVISGAATGRHRGGLGIDWGVRSSI